MHKSKKQEWMKAGILSSLTAFGIVALLMLTNTGNVIVEQTVIEPKSWHRIPLGEADPGAGASGVLNVSIVAHHHFDPYTSNMTYNASYYSDKGKGDVNNTHIGDNVTYTGFFDIIVKVRWNRTHAYNSTAGANPRYRLDWVRGNITCAGLSISADTAMAEYNITGTTNGLYIWVNYVMDNSGAGYQIGRGQNITTCSFTFDAYY